MGLTSSVGRRTSRAVLEATAWQTRDVVDARNADAGVPMTSLAVDGGMTADNLLMRWHPMIDPVRRERELAAWRYAVSPAGAWGARPVP